MKVTSKTAYYILPLLIILAMGAIYVKINYDKRVTFLTSEKGAQWIKYDRPLALGILKNEELRVIFRKNFTLKESGRDINLNFRALKSARLFLDGQLIYKTSENHSNWRKTQSFKIDKITSGNHTLDFFVSNHDGPPVLLAYLETLGIYTDNKWETMRPDKSWKPAALIHENRSAALSKQFPSVSKSFMETLPWGGVIFFIAFAASMICYRPTLPQLSWISTAISLSNIRWFLIIAWGALSINSLIKYPLAGFDYPGHLEYINFIATKGSIPLATDGWQMFQSPLYYMISAAILKLLLEVFSEATSYQFLKVIPLLCGLAQVEIAYRIMKITFPGKRFVQATGLFVASLMPMNLYMSQYIGNEPLAGLFSSIVILFVVKSVRNPLKAELAKGQLLTGLFLGLAILTKVSAVLLLPSVLAMMLWSIIQKNGCHFRNITGGVLRIIFPILIVAGWYYARNMLLLGKPFIGGWDPERGIGWWQDPGCRTIQDLISFGSALTYPVFSGTSGLWDSIYSTLWLDGFLGSVAAYRGKPPWNYSFLLSLSWLSLIPTTGILLGVISTIKNLEREIKEILLFSIMSLLVYFVALIYLYLQLPIYSTAKATYTMGLIPCYALLCGAGLEMLSRGAILRSIMLGLLSWWGVFSFAAYFVL